MDVSALKRKTSVDRRGVENLLRNLEGSASALGPSQSWSLTLRTLLGVIFRSEAQIVLFWGPEFVALYNDAYAPGIGDKHPQAFGRPAVENWGELWEDLGPLLRRVRETGETFTARDRPFYIERHGYPETSYWDVCYSAVTEADGAIAGVLCIVSDTSERVRAGKSLADRESRHRFLLELSDQLRALDDPRQIIATATRLLGERLKPTNLYFSEIDESADRALVQQGAVEANIAPSGEVKVSAYEGPALARLRGGETVRVDDVARSPYPPSGPAASGPLGAFVSVPLMVGGRLCGNLIVTQGAPRAWTDAEVEVMEAVAGRTFEAVTRARAEEQRRRAGEVARHLVDNSPFGVYVVDSDLRIVRISATVRQTFGGAEPFEGAALDAILPRIWEDDFAHEVIARFRETLTTGEPCSAVASHKRRVDTDRVESYDWRLERIMLDDGGLGVVCHFYDLTERRELEAALADRQARLRAVIDTAPVGIVMADAKGEILWANARAEEIIGHRVILSKGPDDYGEWAGFHADGRRVAAHEYPLARALAGETRPELEMLYERPDGGRIWTRLTGAVVRGPEGEVVGALVAVLDIDRQRRAELALRTLNADLAQQVAAATAERDNAWRNARDMIAIVDPKGAIRAISPAVGPTLGWSEEELIGRDVFDFIHPDDHAYSREKIAEAFERPLPATENRFRHKDASWRLISWVTTPEAGVIYAYGRDITEERARAEALAAAQAQLHEMQKMETLGQLTGGVAHDFNNLLTPIVGALDLLSRRVAGDDRATRLVDGGLQAAERARVLIQRLLAFSRRQHLETRPVDVARLVGGMSEILSRTLGPRIRLDCRCPDDLSAVSVDPNQLELALLNLAVNARDAMPDGGVLTIHTERERVAGNPKLADGEYVRIEVRDTGEGMDAETLKRAVEPFFTTKAVGKGTGLGLSSVHGLAAQSGGDFALRSEPGMGTTATLWLPVASGAPPPRVSPERRATSPHAARDITVLLVDDDELARPGVDAMLTEAGFTVFEASSGLEALLRVRSGLPFDVLVTDYAMADMSGVELARELRRLRPALPVLMITGFALPNDADAQDLPRLAKPFDGETLARAVADVLRPA